LSPSFLAARGTTALTIRAINLNTWHPALPNPKLSESQIHVWRAPLKISETTLRRFAGSLSADEQTRALRFHFEKHRKGFVAARGWLRTVLGRYLETSPAALNFTYSSYGKPFISDTGSHLLFNVAHSGDFALYAFTLSSEIGVDIEMINPAFATHEVAERFFSANEVAALRQIATEDQSRAFFDCWTRKEAFIKAQGMGLSLPLDQFEVSLKHDKPQLLRTNWDLGEAMRWSLINIDVGSEYAAALAVPCANFHVTYFYVDDSILECWEGG